MMWDERTAETTSEEGEEVTADEARIRSGEVGRGRPPLSGASLQGLRESVAGSELSIRAHL
ncbi:MAG: hypothetical protein ACKOCN_00345 [Planctomycetaceae bacterium]